LITTAELQSLTQKNLAAMARDFDIAGRSAMTKDDLISAIRKAQELSRKKLANKNPAPGSKKDTVAEKAASPKDVTKKEGARKAAAKQPTAKAKLRPQSSSKSRATRQPTAVSKPSASSKKAKADDRTATSKARRSGTAVAKATRGLTGPAPGTQDAVRSVKPSKASASRSDRAEASKPVSSQGKDPKNATSSSRSSGTANAKSAAAKPAANKAVPPPAPVSPKSRRIREEMRRRSQQAMQNKDLSTGVLVAGSAVRGSTGESEHTPHKDRLVLIVRDSFWLQADWEITRAAVERVRVAMNEKWHHAQPVLRLLSVGDASTNRAEQLLRDIPIHGGVNSWFIDVENPPARFRVVIGYLSENDRFYPLCRSNIVETPKPDAVHRLDRQWRDIAEDYERIYSLSGGYDVNSSGDLKDAFEERLQRQMPSRKDDGLGSDTDAALDRHRALPFDVDAELIIYGSTVPGATVLLSGEPVKLRSDGTFTVRVALPDKRQVLPIIAQSRDSMRQRTTVIAVERNTKVMEAVDRDQNF
jgi:uncharacterized protein